MNELFKLYRKNYSANDSKIRQRTKLYLYGAGIIEYNSINSSQEKERCSAAFVEKNKIRTEDVPIENLKYELDCTKKMKMICFSTLNTTRCAIYKMLNDFSQKKGICAAIIETATDILYFPNSNYSELGLLNYLSGYNGNMSNYRLLMTNSNCGGANV